MERFYPLTGTAALLEALVPAGLRLVQLRMKGLSAAERRRQARRARQCCARHGAQLVLNDDCRLALELGIDFVHLGQEDLAGADFAALRRAGVRYGLSTHDEAELERALALEPAYVALGPVYPTTLKVMKWPAQGLERLARWKERAGATPLVAIGGLTPERAPGVLAAGADSVAVVTDIKSASDPVARCRTWLAVIEGRGRMDRRD